MSLAINNQVIDPTTVSNVACLESCSRSSATYSSITWLGNSAVEQAPAPDETDFEYFAATFEPFTATVDGS